MQFILFATGVLFYFLGYTVTVDAKNTDHEMIGLMIFSNGTLLLIGAGIIGAIKNIGENKSS